MMTSQLTEEEKNFARFFFLNFKVSPDIARRFFDGLFPPAHLAQTINRCMQTIIKLNNNKRINAAQLELLRGVPGTVWPSYLPPLPVGKKATSSKDFDLTMMICLLRNIGGLVTSSTGWDQLPHPSDTLPGAHLATMKWYRNQMAHTTLTSMDNNEFTDKWTRVEKALTALNNGQIPHEVTEILNYDLDGEQAKTLANAELTQLKKEYMDCEKEKEQIESDFSYYKEGNLPKNIEETNAILVETWKKDDVSFYETKGLELVYDKVMDCSCILLTSNSGFGKTATIRHIALKLQQEGFKIVPIESPDDIIKYKKNQNQVFLIDDVIGKNNLSPTLLEKWERINEKLMSCLKVEQGSNKLFCTLRFQIANHQRFKNASTILNQEVINIESESYALSEEEKQKILMKHLKKNNFEKKIKTEEVETMCKTKYAFPLLCKLVSNDEERFVKRIAFFRQPFLLLKEELDKMSNENKELFCILVLCMLFNGSLSRSIFDIESDEYDEKIYRIMQACGLQRNVSKKELENSAFSAFGSYLSEDGYHFRFIHDALEETVGSHFYKFDPGIMFLDCDISFLRDRVRIQTKRENMNDNFDENMVIIQEDELNENHLKPLYNRLSNELSCAGSSCVLMSQLFENRNFVRIFGIHFEKIQRIQGSQNTFFKKVSSDFFGKKPTSQVSIDDKKRQTAVHLAVINNDIELLSLLLRNKAEVNVRDDFNKTPLHYTTSESATKLLLTYSARNQCGEINRNAEEGRMFEKTLMSAFSTMCFNITLKTSFRHIGRDFINIPDWKGNTPLHSFLNRLDEEESSDCIKILLENGANPYLCNDDGTFALDLIKSSCDLVIYKNKSESAKFRQTITKTYKIFAVVMFFLMGVTFGLAIYLSSEIRKESQNALVCVEQFAESGNITKESVSMVQVTRSINVILLTFVLIFWISTITFHMRYSDPYRLCFYLFIVIILLGCGFSISFGAFESIQILIRFMYGIFVAIILFFIFRKTTPLVRCISSVASAYCERVNNVLLILLLILYCVVFTHYINFLWISNDLKFENFYNIRNINALEITALNCTEYMFVNISCTSLTYNISYNNVSDFSVQCKTDPNFRSHSGTRGTLIMDSECIDWSEIGLMFLYILNLALHATCAYCFLQCVLLFVMTTTKFFKGKKQFQVLNGIGIALLYVDIFYHSF